MKKHYITTSPFTKCALIKAMKLFCSALKEKVSDSHSDQLDLPDLNQSVLFPNQIKDRNLDAKASVCCESDHRMAAIHFLTRLILPNHLLTHRQSCQSSIWPTQQSGSAMQISASFLWCCFPQNTHTHTQTPIM